MPRNASIDSTGNASSGSDRHGIAVTNGFTPGGHIPAGYSYLQRSHSLVTPTRRSVPKGMQSPSLGGGGGGGGSIGDVRTYEGLRTSPSMPRSMALHRTESCESLGAATGVHSRTSPILLRHKESCDSLKSDKSASVNTGEGERLQIAELAARLPANPKQWLPSQVALYLTHVLGVTPKPVVDDVAAYVRNARMGGKQFLRLRDKDLVAEGLNLKWRKLMIEAVKKLRRDCLRGRIWGFENGGAQWPSNAADDDDDDLLFDEGDELNGKAAKLTPSDVHSKGTLKRLRDKKAVRGMISNFENISEGSNSGEETFVALGSLRPSTSQASLNEATSPRQPMPPIFAEGYVKDCAANYASRQYESDGPSVFSREQLESWFGSLTDQEAAELADELESDAVEGYSSLPREQRVSSSSSTSSFSSSTSNEDGPMTPLREGASIDLTPIDADVLKAIVESSSADDLDGQLETASSPSAIVPLRSDVFLTDDEDGEELTARKERQGSGILAGANPYRMSTYNDEEVAALGLDTTGGAENSNVLTARKIVRPATSEGGAAQDSIRLSRRTAGSSSCRQIFLPEGSNSKGNDATPSPDVSEEGKDSMREINEGVCPASDVVEANETSKPEEQVDAPTLEKAEHAKESKFDEKALDKGSKSAEDEGDWGLTFSRVAGRNSVASRRGTVSKAFGSAKAKPPSGSAAARMSALFSSSSDEVPFPDTQEANAAADHIRLPLMSLDPSADGKGSVRKTSMVLVERRLFEDLARRMGVLEEQLVQLESLPSDADLKQLIEACEGDIRNPPKEDPCSDSQSKSNATSSSLDDVFTIPSAKTIRGGAQHHSGFDHGNEDPDEGRGWKLPISLGMIPSYGA